METNTSAPVMGVILLIATFDPITYFMRLSKRGTPRMKLEIKKTARTHNRNPSGEEVWGNKRVDGILPEKYCFFTISGKHRKPKSSAYPRYMLQSDRNPYTVQSIIAFNSGRTRISLKPGQKVVTKL